MKHPCKLLAVVKSDGYGHGALPIARKLEKMDCVGGFATATAEEALNQVVEKMGTKVFLGTNTTPEANMTFSSDPQTQINNIKNN